MDSGGECLYDDDDRDDDDLESWESDFVDNRGDGPLECLPCGLRSELFATLGGSSCNS